MSNKFAPVALFLLALFYWMSQQTMGTISPVTISSATISSESNREASIKLLSVAYRASAEEITSLIQEGADVNAVIEGGVIRFRGGSSMTLTGGTPLMVAIIGNPNHDALRTLIENGADVNVADHWGFTPFMRAVRFNRSPDVLRLLIEKGANVNAAAHNGWTPLMIAVSYNQNLDVLRLLLDNGANVNAANNAGRTPLMQAINRPNLNAVRILIENGADANVADNNGSTPLLHAISNHSNLDGLRFLLENGADVNGVDGNGRTPLMFAAMVPRLSSENRRAILRILIENGAEVSAVDVNGRTALMHALSVFRMHSNFNSLRVLIESGTDVGIKDEEGRSAIDYAVGNRDLFRQSRQAHYMDPAFRSGRIGGDVNLDLYHPWSNSARLPRLDTLASLRISGNFPRLDGATSAYPIYAAVANEVFDVSSKEELRRFLSVSRTAEAYSRLISGEVDMIFVLQPSDEQLKAAEDARVELHFTPIARDGFVFFVNSRNPVSGLSIEQIRDIYRGNITNWQEVGGNDRRIMPIQRPANSGSQTAMINDVMLGEELPSPPMEWIQRMMAAAVQAVAQYRNQEEAIGYSFRFFTEEMMRGAFGDRNTEADYFRLLIDLIPAEAPDASERYERYQREIQRVMNPIQLLAVDGVYPSKENIRNGTYPFTVDVFAVTAGTSNPHVQDIIDWLLSPQGQELIEKTGYVGVMASGM